MTPGLTSHQFHLLGLMAEAARVSLPALVDGVVRKLPGAPGLADLDAAGFDTIADTFVGVGFRHPSLPLLSRAQRACLDRCRRRLGLSRAQARAIYRATTDVPSPRLMTGSHFLGLMTMFDVAGVGEPPPAPAFMDRRRASVLRRTAWAAGVDDVELRERMMRFGGTVRLRGLDARAYARVAASLRTIDPPPAPAVEVRPGMVTQAQANVIWRLWLDARRGGDASDAAFDAWIAAALLFPGGLDTVTRAGARKVMDALKACAALQAEAATGGSGRDAVLTGEDGV